jgi:Na+/H+-dicarboxylate symporter
MTPETFKVAYYGFFIGTASLIAYYQLKDFRRTKKIKVVFVLSILWLMFVLYLATTRKI